MTDRIEGKVAQLIDGRTLVINRGSEHGVIIGMRFAILNRQGAAIKDPETGEDLGSVEIDKVTVKVVRVEPKLSIARTYRTFRTGLGFNAIAGLMTDRTEVETLKTGDSTYREELDPKDSYIKVGDPAVQVLRGEFGEDD